MNKKHVGHYYKQIQIYLPAQNIKKERKQTTLQRNQRYKLGVLEEKLL